MIVEESGKVTQKGQVTIPAIIRKKLNIEEGDRLKIIVDDNGEAKIEVIKRKKLSDVYGILGRPPKNVEMPIEEAIQLEREQRGREISDENGRILST